MNWDRVWVSVWYSLIGILVVYEAMSIIDGRDTTPTLTQILVRETPWWITVPFLAWMLVHFASRYLGRPLL